MGLDMGDKNIGIALSDELGITAQAVEVLQRSGNLQQDLQQIAEKVKHYGVGEIVVGLPRNMNGSMGPQGEKIMDFVRKLKNCLPIPVHTWDERLSTVQAERMLIGADVSRKKRRKVIDKMAAAIILQCYLDATKRDSLT